jgi:hypothetical protein
VRLIGFWDGPTEFVLTHGFFKHRTTDTGREIERALKLREWYLEDKERKT